MTNRIFVGLDIPNSIKEDIISQRDQIYGLPNDLNWENESKLHITLKFLGDVGENLSDLIFQRMESIQFSKFTVKFDRFSFFKRNGQLSIMFAAIRNNPAILELYKIIEDECNLIGFNKEKRKFHPHITMLRIKGKEDINRLIKFNNTEIKIPEFEVNTFSIYESVLHQTGSEYLKRKSFYLL